MGRYKRLGLAVCATDRTFRQQQVGGRSTPLWCGKCIHCNTRLTVETDGTPGPGVTVEHIIPRSHGGTDDLRNLALACARCNHAKGRRQDKLRGDDPALLSMVARLQERREGRWRDPPGE